MRSDELSVSDDGEHEEVDVISESDNLAADAVPEVGPMSFPCWSSDRTTSSGFSDDQ